MNVDEKSLRKRSSASDSIEILSSNKSPLIHICFADTAGEYQML